MIEFLSAYRCIQGCFDVKHGQCVNYQKFAEHCAHAQLGASDGLVGILSGAPAFSGYGSIKKGD